MAAIYIHSGSILKYMPFITGLSSSCAVAKMVREIFSDNILLGILNIFVSSIAVTGRGYSSAGVATILYIPLR